MASAPMKTGVVYLDECPVCGADRLAPLKKPRRWIGLKVFGSLSGDLGLNRCTSCGFRFVNPRPSQDVLAEFYGGDEYVCHEHDNSAVASTKARFYLERFSHYCPHGKRLLDFGCGGGFLLGHASRAGWDATGFDIGDRAIATCRASGLKATNNLQSFPPASFDVIVLNHVFEHVWDHRETLGALKRLLAPSGRLFVEVPNAASLRAILAGPLSAAGLPADERYRAFPIHLSYFTPKTLRLVLSKNGFRIVDVLTIGMGIDVLFIRPDAASPHSEVGPGRTGAAGKPAVWKRVIKGSLHGAKLGESVLAVAGPPE